MNNWILLMIVYSFFVSLSEVFKKKATKINSIYEILAFMSTIALLIAFVISRDVFDIDYVFLPIVFLKSLIVVLIWILSLKAIDGLQLGLYGMLKVSRVIFSALLGYFILGESITLTTVLGMLIIIVGLVLVNTTVNDDKNKKTSLKLVFLFLLSCFFSAVSAIIDKKALSYVSIDQLQFWFLFFTTVLYWVILLIRKKKVDFKILKTNYWIIPIAILLVASDRVLFMANNNASSKVVLIVILKQLSVVISIILGRIIFKETRTIEKLLYSLLIIIGVVITLL